MRSAMRPDSVAAGARPSSCSSRLARGRDGGAQREEPVETDEARVEMTLGGAERVAVGVSLQAIQQAVRQLIQAIQRISLP